MLDPCLYVLWLTRLLPLDDTEHPNPRLRKRRLTGESRGAGMAPSDCRGFAAMYRDQIASQLVRTVVIAGIADRHRSDSRSSSAIALAISFCRRGS